MDYFGSHSLLFVGIASLLTVYVAPATMGSEVAEAMGLLNGVNVPDYISLKVFIVKFLGVAFAVSGGLCAGKEGPLVHMGSIVGYSVPYLPLGFTQYLEMISRREN